MPDLALHIGLVAMMVLSNRVTEMNIQARLIITEDAWPPEQSQVYTPLVLIHYKGQRTIKEATAMAECIGRGHIEDIADNNVTPRYHQSLQEALVVSSVTKNVSDILISLEANTDPQFILVEGAPGIGKSFLLKEIAYRWSTKRILHKFKLVLLVCLRDPGVQQISELYELLQSFCIRDIRAPEVATECNHYLIDNNGKDVVFLFDGYDEYPEHLQKNSLIADILKRKILSRCGMIISSRPHASVNLQNQATVRVEILGFTATERKLYIETTLEKKSEKEEIMQYLHQHSTISSLCFIPFNIVVLLYLYKQKITLPVNATELYDHFICLTICRHLAKCGHVLQGTITDLTNLPEPCGKIIRQLSKFSLEALNSSKLIFSLNEIKTACPDIVAIPGAINGFGLLQAIQHFGLTGRTMTLNFVHTSIQEFLAANYITKLPPNEELKIIKEKFWSDFHLNMFSMYIALTKGQHPSFKDFLSGGDRTIAISNEFLNDKIKSFRLYHCFNEAGDAIICNAIEQSKQFKAQKINLRRSILTTNDVECAVVFLTASSHNNWLELYFSYCYIQDHGLHILHRGLLQRSNITVTELGLDYNQLTMLSSPLVSEITLHCKVKQLKITGNDSIGEDQKLYSILTDHRSVLEVLVMNHINLSPNAANNLFNALKDNHILKRLEVEDAGITDEVCGAITAALEGNRCLTELYIKGNNPITSKTIKSVVQALKSNSTLEYLFLPCCLEDIEKIINPQLKVINKQREKQRSQANLRIIY